MLKKRHPGLAAQRLGSQRITERAVLPAETARFSFQNVPFRIAKQHVLHRHPTPAPKQPRQRLILVAHTQISGAAELPKSDRKKPQPANAARQATGIHTARVRPRGNARKLPTTIKTTNKGKEADAQETTENATGQLPTHRPRPPQGCRSMAARKANDARFRSQALKQTLKLALGACAFSHERRQHSHAEPQAG